jgi:hypothetical protein
MALLIAKVEGYPWWPAAQVRNQLYDFLVSQHRSLLLQLDEPSANRPEEMFVYFFGICQRAWVLKEYAVPFHAYTSLVIPPLGIPSKYIKSVGVPSFRSSGRQM